MSWMRLLLLVTAIVLLGSADRQLALDSYLGAPGGSGGVGVLSLGAVSMVVATWLAWRAQSSDRWAAGTGAVLATGAVIAVRADQPFAFAVCLAAIGSAVVALAYWGTTDAGAQTRRPWLAAAVGVSSAAWAAWALASIDVSEGFTRWGAAGEGTWAAIGALSAGAAFVIVRSRAAWSALAIAPLLLGAYFFYYELIAVPVDSINLMWFFFSQGLIVVWALTALVIWSPRMDAGQ